MEWNSRLIGSERPTVLDWGAVLMVEKARQTFPGRKAHIFLNTATKETSPQNHVRTINLKERRERNFLLSNGASIKMNVLAL